jgi:hypothetical protein
MAVPYGFKSWQHYVDKHIAECGACADYYQGRRPDVLRGQGD